MTARYSGMDPVDMDLWGDIFTIAGVFFGENALVKIDTDEKVLVFHNVAPALISQRARLNAAVSLRYRIILCRIYMHCDSV